MAPMREETDLLIHNCINEVLNGLGRSSRVLSVLEREAPLRDLLRGWDQSSTIELIKSNASLLRQTIDCVMGEFDDGEFETRVGVSKAFAE
jgi:hypothetical protein